ncbi:radical SAM protein [Streptosporangium sp. NPDC051022]|uniref:radical SAM protein n=1 Tax=Streptosporangium sp. NPDC051022 TaxID=3155752 RepID=UPI0034220B2D
MKYNSILVSVTEICTVGCSHCGFTGSTRDRQPTAEEIGRWVAQACDSGIPEIIFTGGEPFQRFRMLKSGVRAAAGHPGKPRICVFTSSFWGRSPAAVDKILGQLPGLTRLYLSTDVYHQERVPTQYVMNVIEGALAREIPEISLCITIAEDHEEEQIRGLYRRYEDRVRVHVDRVIPTPFIKTAHQVGLPPDPEHFSSSCYLETPLINPNGDLSACHIGKAGAYVRLSDLAYFLGNLHEKSFQEILDDADANYEYQFLRVYGPQGVARMVASSPAVRKLFGGTTFTNGCDLCYKMLRSLDGRARLREIAADPFQRELIDAVRAIRFGERPGASRTASPPVAAQPVGPGPISPRPATPPPAGPQPAGPQPVPQPVRSGL